MTTPETSQNPGRVVSGRYRLVRRAHEAALPESSLDDSQRAAVAARGSLVRILGGPGTGKSTVAVHAVLDRVADGSVTPAQVLVLAPTRVAAARLRHQVSAGLAATTATPLVCSVQAFAYGLLRRRAATEGAPPPRLLSGPEQDVILRELLSGHEQGLGRAPQWPAELAEATRTRGFRAELRDLLMRAVEHGLDADGLTALAAQESKPVWAACAQVLAEYDEVTALSSPGGYDPAWILTAAADLLEDDPEVLARTHDEIRLVVVDDAQELTAPAGRLVRLLRSEQAEVLLIGDPDVAAQTFRGADPRLMMDEPATRTHTLRHTWRLVGDVAAVAARVSARIGVVGSTGHRLDEDGDARDAPLDEGSPGGVEAAERSRPEVQVVVAPGDGADGADRSDAVPVQPTQPEQTALPVQPTLFDLLDGTLFDAADGTLFDSTDGGNHEGPTAPVHRATPAGPAGPGTPQRAEGTGQVDAVPPVERDDRDGDSPPEASPAASTHRRAHDATGRGPVGPSVDPDQGRTRGRSEDLDGADRSAAGLTPGDVETAVLPTATAEARFVSARLRRAHLLHGVPYSRMAVIVRGAGRSAAMRRVLTGDGVPVDIPGARVPLRDEPAVRPLLTLFEAALDIASGLASGVPAETVLDLLASTWGTTDSLAVRRLLRALRRAERRALENDAAGEASAGSGGDGSDASGEPAVRSNDELLEAAVLGDPVWDHLEVGAPSSGLARIATVLRAGVDAARREEDGWAAGVNAESVLWAMWEASGLAEPWRAAALAGSHRADRDLDAVVALMDAAARYVDRLPHRGPDGFLEHVRGQDVAGDTLVARAPADDCVTLTTPAGAAGLEWDLVVVAGLQEGAWPDLRLRGSVLGSAELVDVVTGRGRSRAAAREAVRSDETRLFLVAVTRTRGSLVCTAVRDEEETPSPFLRLVDGQDEPRPYADAHDPMTLPDAVATLRRHVSAAALGGPASTPDQATSPAPHDSAVSPLDAPGTDAARLLARLARAGVPGAHPREWWSLRDVSDERPRREATERVAVSPSKVEAFARCELRWLLTTSGGRPGGGSVATSLGTLVHDIASEVDNGDYQAMVAELDRRWPELDLPEGWISRRRHEKAVAMLDRLARLHTQALAAGWEVVGTELDVSVALGRAIVRGRVDRLERDGAGRLRVVDLKTGSSKPKNDELSRLPQLGAYQVAVEEGAFEDHGTVSAGAALMQIGQGGNKHGLLQEQPPLAQDDDPEWAQTLLRTTAEGMAGATFRARAGSWCRVCESRFSCPIQPEGEVLR